MWHFIVVFSIHFHHLNHATLQAQKDIVVPQIENDAILIVYCAKKIQKLMLCHLFCFIESSDMKCIRVFSKLSLSFRKKRNSITYFETKGVHFKITFNFKNLLLTFSFYTPPHGLYLHIMVSISTNWN
jgi:hypothetical protein